jgi:membrane associated rhomboid family serine protease
VRRYARYSLNAIWFLLALNVFVFLVTALRTDLVYFLGLTPALLLERPWTVVTNLFVHGSFSHILFNMISLFFLGSFFLRLLGERDFLITYFGGGLVGNVFYILMGPAHAPGVGASGAIFALGGALVLIAPRLPVMIFPVPIPLPLWAAMTFFLLISFFVRGIAWQAHLGGFVLGLLAGYYYRKKGSYRFY